MRAVFSRAAVCAALLTVAGLPAAAQAVSPPLSLKFADFYQRPVGPLGLEPTPQLREADGRTVRLVGWMVAQEAASPGYFLLTPRPVRMSEHADGDADDLPPTTVLVRLPPPAAGQRVPHQDGLLELVGRLSVGRAVEPDGRVSWVRLELPDTPARP